MRFLVVGCSHRTAPLALRERLAFAEAELRAALEQLAQLPDLQEGMVVSTCNREEAYAAASRAGTVGPMLNRCMHRAFATAKRVRNETSVARHPVSVSSVAAELAARIFGDLAESRVLVIGAGEMAELAVQHLLSEGATEICVVNRTFERAVELAFQLGAKAHPFEELTGQLLLADVVITSTGSDEPIVTRDLLAGVMRRRKQRPLFVVDIAVPKDVEPAAADLPNVFLFNIDDLEQVVAENLRARRKEARAAERVVADEVARFRDWLRKQDAVPVIKQLRQHFTKVVRAEAARTAQTLRLERDRDREVLDSMADAIVKKLLHHPTMELKEHAARPDGTFLSRAARRLFQLPSTEGSESVDERANEEEER
jgi:glutamyl-tRNA reductase